MKTKFILKRNTLICKILKWKYTWTLEFMHVVIQWITRTKSYLWKDKCIMKSLWINFIDLIYFFTKHWRTQLPVKYIHYIHKEHEILINRIKNLIWHHLHLTQKWIWLQNAELSLKRFFFQTASIRTGSEVYLFKIPLYNYFYESLLWCNYVGKLENYIEAALKKFLYAKLFVPIN